MAAPGEGHAHRVAIVGATGQVGMAVSRGLREAEGVPVLAIVRAVTDRNSGAVDTLRGLGCEVAEVGSLDAVDAMASALRAFGATVVVVAIRATAESIVPTEAHILEAAKASGTVQRFVADEWGTNTLAVGEGECTLFDAKRQVQAMVKESGLKWTFFFAGGFAHYFLPTFKYGLSLNTFGNLDAPVYTFHMQDIGNIVAKVVIDPRTENMYVQNDFETGFFTQATAVAALSRNFPDVSFSTQHTSSADVLRLRDEAMASDPSKVSAAFGAEPDAERWGINYVVYVHGTLVVRGLDGQVETSTLYPEYKPRSVAELLADPAFVGHPVSA